MAFTVKYFKELPIGTIFCTTPPRHASDTYEWMKVSTRTARLNGNGSVFYFRGTELCHVDHGHWNEIARPQPSKQGEVE